MKWGLLFVLAAALIAGCGSQANYTRTASVLLNTSSVGATPNLTLNFAALGTPLTVTVSQPSASGSTVFTATPSAACNGVAAVTGSASATTANGPVGSFTVIALSTAANCVITVSSTTQGPSGTINVNTSTVQFVSPTNVPISSKEHGAGS